MQAGIKSSIDSGNYVFSGEIRPVGELHVRTKIEHDATSAFVDGPIGCELRFVLLSFAIHPNEHTAGQISHDVRRVVLRQERIQRLGI